MPKEEVEGEFKILGRISFPKVFKPEKVKGVKDGKPRFGLELLVPKSDKKACKDLEDYRDALKNKPPLKGKKVKGDDICIVDGDDEDMREEQKGHLVVKMARAETQGPPAVVGRQREKLRPEDNLVVAGYWFNVIFRLYVPKDFNKICASLEAMQFVKKDESFARTLDTDAAFDDLGEDPDDDDDNDEL